MLTFDICPKNVHSTLLFKVTVNIRTYVNSPILFIFFAFNICSLHVYIIIDLNLF